MKPETKLVSFYLSNTGKKEVEVWVRVRDRWVSVHTTKAFILEETAERHARQWMETTRGKKAIKLELELAGEVV